jgi:hypothetical protein
MAAARKAAAGQSIPPSDFGLAMLSWPATKTALSKQGKGQAIPAVMARSQSGPPGDQVPSRTFLPSGTQLVDNQGPQSTSVSRFTVGACGFLNLSPVGRPPRPITRAEALRDDPLKARFARMLEHYRAAIALGTFCAAELFFRISQEMV